MTETILIVDDETSICDSLQEILAYEGYKTVTTHSAEETQMLFSQNETQISAALIDIWMPGMDGLTLLDWFKSREEEFPVIMMSGHGNIETAVKATKKGAYDFIEKPLSLEKLLITLKHALKEKALEEENRLLKMQTMVESAEIIGSSSAIKSVLEEINQAAPTDGWVLIKGENGTGKELVAKQIHLQSKRQNEPFVAINCAAIPDEMIESELFGYEKGAFVGATRSKLGKFAQAQGGTLFLDEIGDMSIKTQAKILRVLQELQYESLGSNETHEVDLRIIAATNKDLEREIVAGNFREDLFYRLNVIPIEIPPLKTRTEDIEVLSDHFLTQLSESQGFAKKQFSADALDCLLQYHWPGNIRELKNIVERMVIMVKGDLIQLENVPPVVRMATSEVLQLGNLPPELEEALIAFEGQFIKESLKKNSWNLDKTATTLKIARNELDKKVIALNISVPTVQ